MSTSTPLSLKHVLKRKKTARKVCPGCGANYSSRYFETHLNNYLKDGIYICRPGGAANSDGLNDESSHFSRSSETTEDNDFEAINLHTQLQGLVRQKLLKRLPEEDLEYFDLQNESDVIINDELIDDEMWFNETEDSVASDTEEDDNLRGQLGTENQPDNSSIAINSVAGVILIWICIFLCYWQAYHLLTDAAMIDLINFLNSFLFVAAQRSELFQIISESFPRSWHLVWKLLGLRKDNFEKYVICKTCFSLYKFKDCVRRLEGEEISATCTFVPYPNHTQLARRRPCGELLLRKITLGNGKTKLYPYYTYCYKSVFQTLQRFVNRKGFEDACEAWRERTSTHNYHTDIYSGRIWKEFQGRDKNLFLSYPRHYGIMLNLDWFQPFKHVRYSVGVLYAVILNLPRKERFKIQNVMLIGIIPDMLKEPPVNTFLTPLISELKTFWADGFQTTTSNYPKKKVCFKLALLCIGCDVPATRKLCGFLGHSATLGCSKCTKRFPGDIGSKVYGGFDKSQWKPRNLEDHKNHVGIVQRARTQTDKEKLESEFGVRYSSLLELEYFDPIRMSIIDPMHNLFQGTSKNMIRIWKRKKLITDDNFQAIQEKVDGIDAASSIGGLPRKIAVSFGGFTADQWKNWTLYFSIFALKGVLDDIYLENWRRFVLACRAICSKRVSNEEILLYDTLIVAFCKQFEQLYGEECVTPNMHLHCHLAECIKDYGPVYSFWLFSFERYNGHLGSLPNNSRSVEIQLARRFLRNALITSLELPKLFVNEFKGHFTKFTSKSENDIPDEKLLSVLQLANALTEIAGQVWWDNSMYKEHVVSKGVLTSDEHNALSSTYNVLYRFSDEENIQIPLSCWKSGTVSLENEFYGSLRSRHKRSSYIMAHWYFCDGRIISNPEEAELRPGVIDEFLIHNIIVNGNCKRHVFAKVSWLSPRRDLQNYCGNPVQVWSRNLFETFGPASFLPVQRIYCNFVKVDGKVLNTDVTYVCPLSKGIAV